MSSDPTRSDMMSRIRGKDTRPEIVLRKALWNRGLRYRLHVELTAGRPDLAFIGSKVAVFVDGCFWHGCPQHYVKPRSRREFWATKLRTNVERDRRQTLELEELGWTVCRVWEHEVEESLEEVVALIEGVVTDPSHQAGRPSWRVIEVRTMAGDGDQERRVMERLRDGGEQRVVEQERSTRKWKRRS